MKTTRYFREDVLQRKSRWYLRRYWRKWAREALAAPLRTEEEPNGRFQHWIYAQELGCHLRVVFLEDGETLHNIMTDEV
jgi:hypothetical protein